MNPTKKGQKFKFQKQTLTVDSFSGTSGQSYPTISGTWINNAARDVLIIKNKEHGGWTKIDESILLNK